MYKLLRPQLWRPHLHQGQVLLRILVTTRRILLLGLCGIRVLEEEHPLDGLGSPFVNTCTFRENWAEVHGGGLFSTSDRVTVSGSVFCGNRPHDLDGKFGLFANTISPVCPVPACRGDLTGDGQVNVNDFLELLDLWGACF